MAGNVSVESAAVRGGIECCKISIQKLEDASKRLRDRYRQAGAGGWRDRQYQALGGIIDECAGALTHPVRELQECQEKLEELLRAVMEYENTNL